MSAIDTPTRVAFQLDKKHRQQVPVITKRCENTGNNSLFSKSLIAEHAKSLQTLPRLHPPCEFVGFKNRRFFIKTQCHESKRCENAGNKLFLLVLPRRVRFKYVRVRKVLWSSKSLVRKPTKTKNDLHSYIETPPDLHVSPRNCNMEKRRKVKKPNLYRQ